MDWMVALDTQFGPGTVENHRKALSAVYTYGGQLGLSSGNPAALVPSRRPVAAPRPIVNIAEVWPAILEACRDGREQAFLGVMRFAGLRKGEALGLHLADVVTDLAAWRLNVVRQRPVANNLDHAPSKSDNSRRELPVRAPLRRLLAPVLAAGRPTIRVGPGGRELAEVAYLFPYRENDLADLIARLRAVAPLAFPEGHKAWHALRDTLAVEARRGGKTMAEVAEVLGHTSERVTRDSYMGVYGASVHASTLAGLDRHRGGAPPGARRGGARPVLAGPAPRRYTKSPTKGTTCNATTTTRPTQRALPGLAVQPLTRRPQRVRR
jgi:integrase